MIARFLDCRCLKIYPVPAYSYKEDFCIADPPCISCDVILSLIYMNVFCIQGDSASEQTENVLVTMRRVRATIVAVDKLCVLHIIQGCW